jgi:hypothetical protein
VNDFPVRLRTTPWRLAVCRFPADSPLPAWVFHSEAQFWSVTRTPHELSVVCEQDGLPPSVSGEAEKDWRAFEVVGPVPFTATGVVSRLTAPLAEAGIGVFVISTHDTDWLLVKASSHERATELLAARFPLER